MADLDPVIPVIAPVTVIQVAHQLDAVMDHTRVVVMQAGQVSEHVLQLSDVYNSRH